MAVRARIPQKSLKGWKLLEDFKALLEVCGAGLTPHGSWADPKRKLAAADYLCLFLFGLLNPVVRSMRGLCGASGLPRVQKEICTHAVSLDSFSAAQHVLDPALLEKVFASLGERLRAQQPALGGPKGGPRWLIRDSTIWEALPRMAWAFWRTQGPNQNAVRLHLSLHLLEDSPAAAQVRLAASCERKVWRETWQAGAGYIGDRYFGEDYRLFALLAKQGCSFVIRLRGNAVVQVEEELPLSAADGQAKVIRSAWVRLGCNAFYRSIRLRLVWVQTEKEVLRLVTQLTPEELSAGAVALLYKQRWQIELFFRWIKCILGCRHWLAESPAGVAAQIYLALIAALLLQLYTGARPTRRMMELIQFYLLGVATLGDLEKGLARERARIARKKKK
jgi:hypothetical protein